MTSGADDSAKLGGVGKRRASTLANNSSTNKEFLLLYKSNQLHIIQDFMFKITNLKVKISLYISILKSYLCAYMFYYR